MSAEEMGRGVSPLAVGCTRCGANSGVACETRSGVFLTTFHGARRDLAAGWLDVSAPAREQS